MADNDSEHMGEDKARVLLVDDVPVERYGIAQAIETTDDLEVCGRARTVDEALKMIEELQPDLVTLDLHTEAGTILHLIETAKARHKNLKILVISLIDEIFLAERTLRAGASGFISKERQGSSLLAAMRTVLKGEVCLSQDVTDRMLQRMTRGMEEVKLPMDSLSNRELQIFQLFGEGLTTREIAEHLSLSVRTIETHRDNIRDKLRLDNPNQLIRHAAQWNLRSIQQDEQD